MSFTYKQLQAFVAIASTQSYAEAANRLHVTQPALSMSIKTLESLIGGSLMVRTTRKVALTPEGKHFLPKAKRLINEWDDAFQDIHSVFALKQGSLNISAMPSFASSLLPGMIAQFADAYPMVKVIVQDAVMEEVVQGVLRGQAELGFVFEPDIIDGLEFKALMECDFVVVLPENHRFCEKSVLQWDALQHSQIVAMNRGAAIRKWVDNVLTEREIHVQISAEASQLDTLGQLVSVNLGIAIVPALCRNQMMAKGLVCVPLSDSGLRKQIGVIRQERSNLSQAAARFWDHITTSDLGPKILT